MIHTKYVINERGDFALVNKMSGIEHMVLADYIDGPIVRAGFVGNYQGQLETYGNSISLGLSSIHEDGQTIQNALEAGRVYKVFDTVCFNPSWVATSDPKAKDLAGTVEGLEELIKLKIIE